MQWFFLSAAAGVVLFPLFAGIEAGQLGQSWLFVAVHAAPVVAAFEIGCAFLAISTLPVWSFKNFRVPAPFVLPMMLGTGAFAAVLVADPWAALAVAGLLYLGMLPFSRRSFHRLRADAEARAEDEEEGQGVVSGTPAA